MSTTIKFTGLEIEQSVLHSASSGRRVKLPVPDTWYRIECSIPDDAPSPPKTDLMTRVSIWLNDHINGRWGSYTNLSSRKLIIFFEDKDDALLFKLHDGESSIFQ